MRRIILGATLVPGSPRGVCTDLPARPTFIASASAVILREQSLGQSTIVAECDGPTGPGELRHARPAEGMPANATPAVSLLPRKSSVTPRGAEDIRPLTPRSALYKSLPPTPETPRMSRRP